MVEKLTTQRPSFSRRALPSICSGDQWSSTMRERTWAASYGSSSPFLGRHAPRLACARSWAVQAPWRPRLPLRASSPPIVDLSLPRALAVSPLLLPAACISAISSLSLALRCVWWRIPVAFDVDLDNQHRSPPGCATSLAGVPLLHLEC